MREPATETTIAHPSRRRWREPQQLTIKAPRAALLSSSSLRASRTERWNAMDRLDSRSECVSPEALRRRTRVGVGLLRDIEIKE